MNWKLYKIRQPFEFDATIRCGLSKQMHVAQKNYEQTACDLMLAGQNILILRCFTKMNHFLQHDFLLLPTFYSLDVQNHNIDFCREKSILKNRFRKCNLKLSTFLKQDIILLLVTNHFL